MAKTDISSGISQNLQYWFSPNCQNWHALWMAIINLNLIFILCSLMGHFYGNQLIFGVSITNIDWYHRHFFALAFPNELKNCHLNARFNSCDDAFASCKNLWTSVHICRDDISVISFVYLCTCRLYWKKIGLPTFFQRALAFWTGLE